MYLSKEQINELIDKVGQIEGIKIFNKFFGSYRKYLSSNDVGDLYDDEYYQKISSIEKYKIVNGQYEINIFNKYSYEYIIKKDITNVNVLDVGCGDASFLLALAHERKDSYFTGIDFSELCIARGLEKIKRNNIKNCSLIHCDVSELDTTNKYDFVILNDISEHLSDNELTSLLIKISKILSETGEILIHTPNGLAFCNDTDSNFIKRLYKLSLIVFKKAQTIVKTKEQLYYEQMHINIKSYRQLKRLLYRCNLSSKVEYDTKNKISLLNCLSTNMLVTAKVRKGKA